METGRKRKREGDGDERVQVWLAFSIILFFCP